MAGADGPARARVPEEDRAWRKCRRPLAPHLVEAPALPRRFVIEDLDVLAGIEVRAARALIVDPLAVREEWTTFAVHCRQPPERQEVHDRRRDHVADRRAPRDVHDRLA